jgi:hypothetical protein
VGYGRDGRRKDIKGSEEKQGMTFESPNSILFNKIFESFL